MTDNQKMSVIKNLPTVVARSFRDIRAELKKVIWPTPQQLLTSTTAVVVSCVVIGVLIWLIDAGLTVVLENFIIGK